MAWPTFTDRSTGYNVTSADWNTFNTAHNHISATRWASLPIADAIPPLSVRNPAALEQVESNAGTPKASWHQARFDAGTIEALQWELDCPNDYGGTAKIVIQGYMATAVAGTIVMNAYFSAQSVADVTGTTLTYGTVTAGTFTVPGTACTIFAGTLTIGDTNGLVVGDKLNIEIERIGTATADTAGGDYVLRKAMMTYGM